LKENWIKNCFFEVKMDVSPEQRGMPRYAEHLGAFMSHMISAGLQLPKTNYAKIPTRDKHTYPIEYMIYLPRRPMLPLGQYRESAKQKKSTADEIAETVIAFQDYQTPPEFISKSDPVNLL